MTKSLEVFGLTVEQAVHWSLDQLQARKEVEKTPLIPVISKEWIDYKFNDPIKELRYDTLRQIRSFGNMIAGDLPTIHIKELAKKLVEEILQKKRRTAYPGFTIKITYAICVGLLGNA